MGWRWVSAAASAAMATEGSKGEGGLRECLDRTSASAKLSDFQYHKSDEFVRLSDF